jgi:RNA polymerase sigma-70 factor (ECF subfamily)
VSGTACQSEGAAAPAAAARAAGRLRLLCATLLYKSYPRPTRPPVNLETDELLGGVVARLIKVLQTARPPAVRRFFALANQYMRWQLNDLARRLDEQAAAAALARQRLARVTLAELARGK